MSLTGTHHVFAAINETGVNTFLKAFFTARPRFLNWGSPLFVPFTNASVTQIPAIDFPGVGGGIQYELNFNLPAVDLFPPDIVSPPAPIVPSAGGLTVHTALQLIVGCSKATDKPGTDGRPGPLTPLSTSLDVWAEGTPTSQDIGPGVGFIGFVLENLLIPTILPDSLRLVLDCVIRMILEAVLENATLPFQVVTVDTVALILQQGPEISNDQIKLWGDI